MNDVPLSVLAVVGSMQRESVTRIVVRHVAQQLQAAGCTVDVLDFEREPVAIYNPDTTHDLPGYPELQARVHRADVVILGSPDYHGGISGAMKNFLDHFWHEFAGKLFATIVSSHEKGLTVMDQLRTVARQCYAWTLPYGVSLTEKRRAMLIRDLRVYGELLARQRRADLAATESGFLARHRK
jgi:NAD(P)H-dependent FMN reductase